MRLLVKIQQIGNININHFGISHCLRMIVTRKLIDETFENGKGITWVYDGDLLLMQKQKGGEPNIERYEYDDKQRVSLIENNYSRKSFNYDAAGKLISTNKKDENERTIAWERYEYTPSSY